jgi:hypothetical protein
MEFVSLTEEIFEQAKYLDRKWVWQILYTKTFPYFSKKNCLLYKVVP